MLTDSFGECWWNGVANLPGKSIQVARMELVCFWKGLKGRPLTDRDRPVFLWMPEPTVR
jgi:hypothetical protein